MSGPAIAAVFPLVRHLSRRLTPVLLASPISANQVTALSLAFGLAGAALLAVPDTAWRTWAALLLVVCYVLDNCDGEVARGKNQCTPFGARFDPFVDWIVHAAIFAGIGVGEWRADGDRLWLWLAVSAVAGATINYGIGFWIEALNRRRKAEAVRAAAAAGATAGGQSAGGPAWPETAAEWAVFAFRELSRADFCLIVLGLALVDGLWILAPLGAVGAHVYWITQFAQGAQDYHV